MTKPQLPREVLASHRVDVVRIGSTLALADLPNARRLHALAASAAAAIFDLEVEADRITRRNATKADHA